MMVINLLRDDSGVWRLKDANAVKPVASVAPRPATTQLDSQPQAAVPDPSAPIVAPDERRSGERRRSRPRRGHGGRAAILLDTRSRHERRTRIRRLGSDRERHYQPLGINIHI